MKNALGYEIVNRRYARRSSAAIFALDFNARQPNLGEADHWFSASWRPLRLGARVTIWEWIGTDDSLTSDSAKIADARMSLPPK